MRIQELIAFIRSLVPGLYFPNSFPRSTESRYNNGSAVKLTGGFPPSQWTGKTQPSFQVRVRGSDVEECEERAYLIHGMLLNLRNVKIGNNSIVIIRSMNSVPLHLGEDENNRTIYSMNFDCVVRPK